MPDFGWAVNVGANDGVFADNTGWLESAGWMVLCVEPIPETFEKLRTNRRWATNVAAWNSDAEDCDFHVSSGDGASHSALVVRQGPTERVVKVRTRRLERILAEHSFPRLDYLSVDVEGSEAEVLSGLDIERWRPEIMVIERHNGQPDRLIPGYDLVNRCGFDDVFVRS